MSRPLRLLIVEDSKDDALLLRRHLERSGYDLTDRRVDTARALREALQGSAGQPDSPDWDFVVADYSMPGFNGLEALKILQDTGLDIPFILVSGTIGEELAVEAMRAGAQDYIMKDNLARLVPAVERELREAETRSLRRSAEEALKESELRFRTLVDQAGDAFFLTGTDGRIVDVNRRACESLGYTREELLGMSVGELDTRSVEDRDENEVWSRLRVGETTTVQGTHRRKDGSEFPVEIRLGLLDLGGEKYMLGLARDVTERQRMEERLSRLNETFLRFGSDPMENINLLLSACGELMGASFAHYIKLEQGRLRARGEWNVPRDYTLGEDPEGSMCFDVIHRGRDDLYVVRNLPETDYVKTELNIVKFGLKTYMGQAVKFGDGYGGSICLVFQDDCEPTRDDEWLVGMVASGIAVEEVRHRAEEALKESEDRFRILFEKATDTIFIVDPAHPDGPTIVNANEAAFIQYRYTPQELIGKTISVLDTEGSRRHLPERVEKLTSGGPMTFEEDRVRQDGTVFPVEVSARLIPIGGKPFIYSIERDITERKLAEAALRESESRLWSIFRAAPTGIGLVSDRVITQVNERLCEMLGYEPEELLNQPVRMIYPTREDYEWVGREKYGQIKEKGTGTVETRWKRKDGRLIDVLLSSTPLDASDLTAGVTFTALDITERKKIEAELAESEEKYHELFTHSNDGIFLHDLEGNIIDINTKTLRMLGYEKSEIQSLKIMDLHTPEVLAASKGAFETIAREGFVNFEILFRRKDGTTFPADVSSSIFEIRGEKVILGIARDISERKNTEAELELYRDQLEKLVADRTRELEEAQERLIASERLAILGQFAGSLSHEIRNPLAVISNAAYYLGSKVETADESVSRSIETIRRRVMQAAELIESILRLSRMEEPVRERIDLADCLREVVDNFGVPEAVNVGWSLPETPAEIDVDPDQLRMAARNIIQNSVQAMPRGGEFSVALVPVEEDTGGRWWEICFSDTGQGVGEEELAKIFEPLFTTKTYGIGFGLSIVRMIVERHGGTVAAAAGKGGGMVLTMRLPAPDEGTERGNK